MTEVRPYSEEEKKQAQRFVEERVRKTGSSAVRWALGLSIALLAMFVIGHFVSITFMRWGDLLVLTAVATFLQLYAWVQSAAVIEREIADTNLAANDNLVSSIPGIIIVVGAIVRPLFAWTLDGNYLSLLEWLIIILAMATILKDVIINSRAAQKIAFLTNELAKVK